MRKSALVTLLLLLLAPAALSAPEPKAEAARLRKIARAWVKLGEWCVPSKLGTQARACAKLALQASRRTALGIRDVANDCPDDPGESVLKEWKRKRKSTGRRVAKLYDGLSKRSKTLAVEYSWRALEASPTGRRWSRAVNSIKGLSDAPRRAAGFAKRGLGLDPPAKLKAVLEGIRNQAAVDALLLEQATKHPMNYYYSLPSTWRPNAKRKWPVLVCVDGAGSNFENAGKGYMKLRKDLPCIIVSPCGFANTNRLAGKMRKKYEAWYSAEEIERAEANRFDWDEEGLLAVLDDVQERFNAEERIYITGFSGGGNLTYLMVFKHPDRVNGAVPACANFTQPGYRSLEGQFEAADLGFPIHMITGAEDPHRELTHGKKGMPGIEPQTDWAEATLEQLGYRNVRRTLVPKLKHNPARRRVLDILAPYIRGERKRDDPLPE